jgi:CRP-like cAMP-binding protein
MRDVHPHIVRRMLQLHRFSLFSGAELGELATVADNLVETVMPPGAVIVEAGARVPAMHMVLDGRIEAGGRTWGPREVFGELEVLAKRRHATTAVTAVKTRTLQLLSPDVSELLEDNFGLLLAELRGLARRFVDMRAGAMRRVVALPRTATFGLVERLIILRQQIPFAQSHLQALAMIAHASEEVLFQPSVVLARAGESATEALVLLDGQVVASSSGVPVVIGPGTVVGDLEMLGGLAHTHTLESVTPVRALRTSEAALYDALEDHTDFGLAIITSFANALVERGEPHDRVVAATAN